MKCRTEHLTTTPSINVISLNQTLLFIIFIIIFTKKLLTIVAISHEIFQSCPILILKKKKAKCSGKCLLID